MTFFRQQEFKLSQWKKNQIWAVTCGIENFSTIQTIQNKSIKEFDIISNCNDHMHRQSRVSVNYILNKSQDLFRINNWKWCFVDRHWKVVALIKFFFIMRRKFHTIEKSSLSMWAIFYFKFTFLGGQQRIQTRDSDDERIFSCHLFSHVRRPQRVEKVIALLDCSRCKM